MFDLKANLVLISVDFDKAQKNILSLSDNTIIFPSVNIESLTSIEDTINNYGRNLFQDSLIMAPYINNLKLIELHNQYLSESYPTTINMIYGTTVPKATVKSDYYWFPFDFTDTMIANQLTIIGKVISHSI